jgi:riboflavin biosynthesis pyrimidine reductase
MNSSLQQLANWPTKRTVQAILIQSKTGQLQGLNHSSSTLSNPIDREFLKQVRASADLVIVGAQTIRTENPPAPNCQVFVISKSLNLTAAHRIFNNPATVIVSNQSHSTLPTLLLPNLGVTEILNLADTFDSQRILVEGGLSLYRQFIDAKVLDQALITVSPVQGEGEILHRSKFGLNLVQQVKLNDYAFQRWVKEV